MITLPTDVLKHDVWDQSEINSQSGNSNPNKDSRLDFAEHQQIVCAARGLLQGTIATGNPAADLVFQALQNAYNVAGGTNVVVITKGIHQVGSDAHIKLQLVDAAQKANQYAGTTFHLNVEGSAGTLPSYDTDSVFVWKPTQFKCWVGGLSYCWPSPASSYSKDRRRNSISSADLAAHVAAADAARRAAVKLAQDTAKNAEFQRAYDKFKTTHPTEGKFLNTPKPGKALRERLKSDGSVEFEMTVNAKAQTVKLTFSNGAITKG